MKYPSELAGLRGLAAAYVLLRHSLWLLPLPGIDHLLDNGFGVKLFLIVSGFSIYWLLDTKRPAYDVFIIRRAVRILPVYLVGLAVSASMLDFVCQTLADLPASPMNAGLLHIYREDQRQLVAHLATHAVLLHGLIPESLLPDASHAILGPAWSLTVEWQFYLVAPLALGWVSTLRQWRSQVCLVALVAGLLCCGAYFSTGFLGNNLPMLSLGLASYALIKRFREDDGALRVCMLAMLGLTAVWDARVLPTVVVWVVTLYAATTLRPCRFAALVSNGLRRRVPQYLGRLGYSFYIFHMAALFLCLRIIDRIGMPSGLRSIALPLMAFALTIVVAELANRFIEEPMRRLGRGVTAQPVPQPCVLSIGTAAA